MDGSNIQNQWVDVSLHVMKQTSKEFRLGSGSQPPFGPDVPDEMVVMLKGLPFSLLEDEVRVCVFLDVAWDCVDLLTDANMIALKAAYELRTLFIYIVVDFFTCMEVDSTVGWGQ